MPRIKDNPIVKAEKINIEHDELLNILNEHFKAEGYAIHAATENKTIGLLPKLERVILLHGDKP